MNKEIITFKKDCFANYLKDIQQKIPAIPNPYIYPDGNPIRPVVPTQTVQNSIMLIGAFPSAKFERRNGMLIPTGDNLSPFAQEEYFDGREVRRQASRDSLELNYFPQLGIDPQKIWITDIVKFYLYPEKHLKNCRLIAPHLNFVNTHCLFKQMAEASMQWMEREIVLCNPRIIITLGEVPARAISGDRKTPSVGLLNGNLRTLHLNKDYKIAHLGHPEIRRISKEWDKRTEIAIDRLSRAIK